MTRTPGTRAATLARFFAWLLAVVLFGAVAAGGWAVLRSGRPVSAAALIDAVRPASTTPTVPVPSATPDPVPTPTPSPAATPMSSVLSSSPGPVSPSPSPSPSPSATLPEGLTAADVGAGLRSRSFPQRGAGRFRVVKGEVKAPRKGREYTVRVEVEVGLDVDGKAFADFALATLNDKRSWAHDGYAFARTDGPADVRLVLASPDTSAQMCLPLRTYGRLSCRVGGATVLTVYRWVKAIPGYGEDHTGYRQYLVNHEVGHALGHGHLSCPGTGRLAPTMMQQTKGLHGCLPNPWPYP